MYKSIIIEYIDKVNFVQNDYGTLVQLLEKSHDNFTNYLFVVVDNIKYEKYPLTLHLSDWAEKKSLILIDEWIWLYFEGNTINQYNSIFKSILWFSKKESTIFNKDLLRTTHIWKDVEWGKREKNYHPLGKDPGNVLLLENAKNGIIQEQNTISNPEIIAKLVLCQIENDTETYHFCSNKPVNLTDIQTFISQKTEVRANISFEKID